MMLTLTKSCYVAIALTLVLGVDLSGDTIPLADLAADYREPASPQGQTSDDMNIRGTTLGAWHYFQDRNSTPADGVGPLLHYRHQNVGGDGNGYAGSESWNQLYMPLVTDQSQFDGRDPANVPPNSLVVHPALYNYVAIEYRLPNTMDDLHNTSVVYRFEKPNVFGAVDAYLYKVSGGASTVLFGRQDIGSGVENVSGTLSTGTLHARDSLWLYVGSWYLPFGDQAFVRMTVLPDPSTAVPEPGTAALLVAAPLGLAGVLLLRRRNQASDRR
jgi:hypothetical protein